MVVVWFGFAAVAFILAKMYCMRRVQADVEQIEAERLDKYLVYDCIYRGCDRDEESQVGSLVVLQYSFR